MVRYSNAGQPNHFNTGQMDAILLLVLVQVLSYIYNPTN